MSKIPEDIILIIFRYLHRNKMKLLNQEYQNQFFFVDDQFQIGLYQIYCERFRARTDRWNYRKDLFECNRYIIGIKNGFRTISNVRLPKHYYKK